MFICKGLHCACCKTFGAGPLLALAILYVIAAQNHGLIVTLLLHALMLVVAILGAASVLIGIAYAVLTKIVKHVTRYEYGGKCDPRGVRNATQNYRSSVVRIAPHTAVDNHRDIPVLYRAPYGRPQTGQFQILERCNTERARERHPN